MRKLTIILITAIYAITTSAYAQNYDEAKVGNYPLPDPLTFTDGKIASVDFIEDQWSIFIKNLDIKDFEIK